MNLITLFELVKYKQIHEKPSAIQRAISVSKVAEIISIAWMVTTLVTNEITPLTFLACRSWTMIEIKGDYMIDDAVTAAKEKYAMEMGFVNKMEYRMMEASLVGNGQILS